MFFIFSIFNNKILYCGTLSGINLILFTVIPAIFPFLIITSIMNETNSTDFLSELAYPFIKRILGLSKNSGYVIIIGFLCGYPIAAKLCSDLVNDNKITLAEGNYLLTFINNASPSFIISYIATNLMHSSISSYKLIICIYLPSFITAIIFNPYFRHKQNIFSSTCDNLKTNTKPFNFENIIISCIKSIVKISGYILVFSIVCEFTKLIPNNYLHVLICSFFEITTGAHQICIQTFNSKIKYSLLVPLTAFGGLSSLFQVKSVIFNSALNIKYYILGKISCVIFSIILLLVI